MMRVIDNINRHHTNLNSKVHWRRNVRSLPLFSRAVYLLLTPPLELSGLLEVGPFLSGSVEALMASHVV